MTRRFYFYICHLRTVFIMLHLITIKGLHMHVGSMGMDLTQIIQGAKQLIQLADKINAQAGKERCHFWNDHIHRKYQQLLRVTLSIEFKFVHLHIIYYSQ